MSLLQFCILFVRSHLICLIYFFIPFNDPEIMCEAASHPSSGSCTKKFLDLFFHLPSFFLFNPFLPLFAAHNFFSPQAACHLLLTFLKCGELVRTACLLFHCGQLFRLWLSVQSAQLSGGITEHKARLTLCDDLGIWNPSFRFSSAAVRM